MLEPLFPLPLPSSFDIIILLRNVLNGSCRSQKSVALEGMTMFHNSQHTKCVLLLVDFVSFGRSQIEFHLKLGMGCFQTHRWQMEYEEFEMNSSGIYYSPPGSWIPMIASKRENTNNDKPRAHSVVK